MTTANTAMRGLPWMDDSSAHPLEQMAARGSSDRARISFKPSGFADREKGKGKKEKRADRQAERRDDRQPGAKKARVGEISTFTRKGDKLCGAFNSKKRLQKEPQRLPAARSAQVRSHH